MPDRSRKAPERSQCTWRSGAQRPPPESLFQNGTARGQAKRVRQIQREPPAAPASSLCGAPHAGRASDVQEIKRLRASALKGVDVETSTRRTGARPRSTRCRVGLDHPGGRRTRSGADGGKASSDHYPGDGPCGRRGDPNQTARGRRDSDSSGSKRAMRATLGRGNQFSTMPSMDVPSQVKT